MTADPKEDRGIIVAIMKYLDACVNDLEAVIGDREDHFNEKDREWQASEIGEEYATSTATLQDQLDAISEARDELDRVKLD